MPTFNCAKCQDMCQDMKEVMRNCAGDSPFILAEATESSAPSGQAEFDLLGAMAVLAKDWESQGGFLNNQHDHETDRAAGRVYQKCAKALKKIASST